MIVIDKAVIDFLANIPALRHLTLDNQLAEPVVKYFVNDADTIWRQIVETMHLMTPAEQLHLRDLLAREGISGFLSRLGIAGGVSLPHRFINPDITIRIVDFPVQQ